VELGEGISGSCRLSGEALEKTETAVDPKIDVSSLGSMLQSKWKGGQGGGSSRREAPRSGQIRSFRIVKLDPAGKKIELELA
jgi:small subunit ribosomal protein S1